LLPAGELARLPEARWLASLPQVRVVFRSNSMPALVAAAIAGQGLAPLADGWGAREPALERALALDTIARRKVWLVTHEAATRRPAVEIVADQIASIFARLFAR
jgi:DNA-binding transcriptional LysR family regulator